MPETILEALTVLEKIDIVDYIQEWKHIKDCGTIRFSIGDEWFILFTY